MSVNEGDFTEAADKAVNNLVRETVWPVFDTYYCDHAQDRDGPVGVRYVYAPECLRRKDVSIKNRVTGAYAPLLEDSLFLRFARLAEDERMDVPEMPLSQERLGGVPDLADDLDTERNRTIALRWADGYGVLGLTPHPRLGTWWPDPRGGDGDSVERFAYEAWVANGCLRLYEAATAEELDMDLIASYFDNPRYKSHYTRTPAIAREFALGVVATETQKRVTGNAYPAFYGVVGRFVSGWSFTTLLGAMWLQMFWLLTASEAPRRCSNWECDKIIAYEQPDRSTRGMKRNDRSGGYVTRKDKRFCHKRCRDRYHYLTKTKPRRHVARDL